MFVGSGFALDAARKVLRDSSLRRERLDRRRDRRMRRLESRPKAHSRRILPKPNRARSLRN